MRLVFRLGNLLSVAVFVCFVCVPAPLCSNSLYLCIRPDQAPFMASSISFDNVLSIVAGACLCWTIPILIIQSIGIATM